MTALILDEWLWSDLKLTNGLPKQKESVALLLALQNTPDRLIVVIESPFEKKFWDLCKTANDSIQRNAVKIFRSIFFDSSKCLQISRDELPAIPLALQENCKEEDQYLVQAQHAVPGSIIITTDQPLIKLLNDQSLPCEHRDTWLVDYLQSRGNESG